MVWLSEMSRSTEIENDGCVRTILGAFLAYCEAREGEERH